MKTAAKTSTASAPAPIPAATALKRALKRKAKILKELVPPTTPLHRKKHIWKQKIHHPTEGSRQLLKAVKAIGSFERAADALNACTSSTYMRASIWHWATGLHTPNLRAAMALQEWASIDPQAWHEP